MSRRTRDFLLDPFPGPRPLTPRQRQVLAAYVEAESAKDAALLLGCPEHAVRQNLHRAHLRWGVDTTLGLLKAIGWLAVPE